MNPQYIYTPFSSNVTLPLPVELSTLSDVQVLFLVNGLVKVKFKKVAATGWVTWTAGGDGKSVVCALTTEQTSGWRGLVTAQIVQVDNAGNPSAPCNKHLYIAKLSGYTPHTLPTPNPITGTLAFSCSTDGAQTLTFTASISAPNGNYIVQIQIKGEWKRLYRGYIVVTNGVDDANGTGSYTAAIIKNEQVAAGKYPIRFLNDGTSPLTTANGAASEPADTYIVDCWQGEERRDYENYFNGLFAVWGWE